MEIRLIVALFVLFIGQCQGLKILMYQVAFSNTHMPFSGAIADSLIDRGHVVDKIIIAYHSGVKNNGSTRLRNVFRIALPDEDNVFMNSLHLKDPFAFKYFSRRDPNGIRTRTDFCKRMMEDKALLKQLKAEKYDVFLVAPFDFCSLGLNHILQIASVNMYSVLAQDGTASLKLGTLQLPSYVPQIYNSNVQGKNKDFWERLRSFLYLAELEYDEEGLGVDEMAYLKKRIPNLPSITEMFKTISYIFLNTNEIIDTSQPMTGRTKFIGGIAMRKNDGKLTEEVEKILSIPNNGAVLFSFGSLIQTTSVPLNAKLNILQAFNSFPEYSFIWKIHEDDEVRLHLQNFTNIHPITWLPQIPLLHDNRVKAFITHMGQNSYLELNHAGKPVIGIPFFVDQFYNMDCALRNEIGVHIDKRNLTTESMVNALKEVLFNKKYTKNAKDISLILKDRPVNVKEELVRYVEFSAKHPRISDFLQLESADMPLWKLYSLDVISFLVIISLGSIILLVTALKIMIKAIRVIPRISKLKGD